MYGVFPVSVASCYRGRMNVRMFPNVILLGSTILFYPSIVLSLSLFLLSVLRSFMCFQGFQLELNQVQYLYNVQEGLSLTHSFTPSLSKTLPLTPSPARLLDIHHSGRPIWTFQWDRLKEKKNDHKIPKKMFKNCTNNQPHTHIHTHF